MRAKLENSSTMRRRSPTWRTIVPVSRSNVSLSDADLLAEAALQPLGGELDRGQRVLDLMRDAPRDVGPGGAALVGQLVGDVVEGQHRAVLVAHALDRERALAAVGGDRCTFASDCSPRMNSSSSGETDARPLPFELFLALLEQRLGRAVDEQDAMRAVDRDDAGGDARQHRLDEGAAGVELRVGGAQRARSAPRAARSSG